MRAYRTAAVAAILLARAVSGADGYVGSSACAGCHRQIYDGFRQTAMGQSMRERVPALPEATVANSRFGVSYGVAQRANGIYQSEQSGEAKGVPGFQTEHRLAYAIGSGVNGITFAIRRENHLFQAPLSYYSRGARWDLSPGYEFADYGFSRLIHEGCIVCHSGRARPVVGSAGRYQDPPFAELAIGCENCHGPGETHVRAATKKANIVNPRRLAPRLAEQICMNCHQGGDSRVLQPGQHYSDFRPGQWLGETVSIFALPDEGERDLLEHHTAMAASTCFRESSGKLSCLSCHDVHRKLEGAAAVQSYRAKCLSCHREESCQAPRERRAAASDNCMQCHMPRRDIAVISHSALTNHRIPAHPDQVPKSAAGKTDLLHLNPVQGKTVPKLTLLRAYGEVMDKRPKLQARYLELLDDLGRTSPNDAFVQAALGRKAMRGSEPDANARAIEHLSRSINLGFRGYTAYEDLAEALTRAGRTSEAVEILKRALANEPYVQSLHKALALRYIQLKQYDQAREAMTRYVELFPHDPFMRGLLQKVGGPSRRN